MTVVADAPSRLVSTGEAAAALGIDRSTLSRWANAGLVTPAWRTAGGHMRWDLEQLQDQAESAWRREHDNAPPPFSPELADAPKHPDEPG